jgi:hypothetical protein
MLAHAFDLEKDKALCKGVLMSGRNSRRPIETFRDDELSNPNGAGIQGRQGITSKTPRPSSAKASLPMHPAAHRTVNPFRCRPYGDSRIKVTRLTGPALWTSVDWLRYAGRADSGRQIPFLEVILGQLLLCPFSFTCSILLTNIAMIMITGSPPLLQLKENGGIL